MGRRDCQVMAVARNATPEVTGGLDGPSEGRSHGDGCLKQPGEEKGRKAPRWEIKPPGDRPSEVPLQGEKCDRCYTLPPR